MPGLGKRRSDREKAVVAALGLDHVPASGSGWVAKEDGEDGELLLQLKSTDGRSITVSRQDVRDLLYHAAVSHKIPLFALDFTGDFVLVATTPERVASLARGVRRRGWNRWDGV